MNVTRIITIVAVGAAVLATATLNIASTTNPRIVTGGEIQYKSSYFSHESHVGMGFGCQDCHVDIFAFETGEMLTRPDFSMQAMYDGKFCGTCHDGSTAFPSDRDCTSCHNNPGGDIIYTEPVVGVIFSHEDHNFFGCESCHEGLFPMEALETQKADNFNMEALYDGLYCGTCHDGQMAFAANTRCASCHVGVKGYNRAKE